MQGPSLLSLIEVADTLPGTTAFAVPGADWRAAVVPLRCGRRLVAGRRANLVTG